MLYQLDALQTELIGNRILHYLPLEHVTVNRFTRCRHPVAYRSVVFLRFCTEYCSLLKLYTEKPHELYLIIFFRASEERDIVLPIPSVCQMPLLCLNDARVVTSFRLELIF